MKTVQNSTDLLNQRLQQRSILLGDEAATGSKFVLGIEFPVRSESNRQMMNVSGCLASVPFGDVGGNRYGAFPHLVRQSEPFARRKVVGDIINAIGKVHRFLPRNQVPKALDVSHGSSIRNDRTD